MHVGVMDRVFVQRSNDQVCRSVPILLCHFVSLTEYFCREFKSTRL